MARKIRGTDFDNLDLLPSSLSHRNLDLVLVGSLPGLVVIPLVVIPLVVIPLVVIPLVVAIRFVSHN